MIQRVTGSLDLVYASQRSGQPAQIAQDVRATREAVERVVVERGGVGSTMARQEAEPRVQGGLVPEL